MSREIATIAEQIINIKLPDEIIESIKNVFYEVARQNNIRMGTKSESGAGIICDNPEWTMCKILFLQRIKDQIDFSILFEGTPDDLKVYGEDLFG